VSAPLTQINFRAADSESDDGLVWPLQNGKRSSLFCTHEDWNTRCHPRHPFVSCRWTFLEAERPRWAATPRV